MSKAPQATPYYLQMAMVEEVKRLTKDILFEKPDGSLSGLNVFPQNLPNARRKPAEEAVRDDGYSEIEDYGEEDSFYFPWCLVKLDSGKIKEPNGRQTAILVLVFGVYDESDGHEGYQKLLTMYQKIVERFAKNPVLSDQFRLEGEMNWAIQDEDEDSASGIGTSPYQFGALSMTFSMPGYRREDPFT